MCGLFGVICSPTAKTEVVADVLIRLGRLSVERGRDSAGLAFIDLEGNTHALLRREGAFNQTFRHTDLRPLEHSRIVLGHTRWATQGSTKDLANMSPMPVGALIGTHNGDVAKTTIPHVDSLPTPNGSTDTEVLYQSIESEASLAGIAKVLSVTQGRAALAWVDSRETGTVFLARAALSPLATARDTDGNIYWASNPQWFRRVAKAMNGRVEFRDITLVAEGTLAAIDALTGEVRDMERFVPQCRDKDLRIADIAAWRGFTKADRDSDVDSLTHIVVKAPVVPASRAPRFTTPAPGWSPSDHRQSRWDFDSRIAVEDLDPDDEAEAFVLEWIEDGSHPDVRGDLMWAVTPFERAEVAESYGLSDVSVLSRVRRLLADF